MMKIINNMIKMSKGWSITIMCVWLFIIIMLLEYVIKPYLFSETSPKLWIFLAVSIFGVAIGGILMYFLYDGSKKDRHQKK